MAVWVNGDDDHLMRLSLLLTETAAFPVVLGHMHAPDLSRNVVVALCGFVSLPFKEQPPSPTPVRTTWIFQKKEKKKRKMKVKAGKKQDQVEQDTSSSAPCTGKTSFQPPLTSAQYWPARRADPRRLSPRESGH